MATFAEKEAQLGLKKFADSPRGTMFTAPGQRKMEDGFMVCPLVRRLDGFVTPELASTYAEMVEAADAWVAQHPDLDQFVRVMPLTEVGDDFITRMHFAMRGTTAFAPDEDDDEIPPEVPVELEEMRAAFQAAKGKLTDPKSKIIERVLERNLAEPSSLTFFDDQEAAFFIVEPHIREEDLKEFAEAG